jgi:predicted RNA-binding Zn-ribbon protein involved in translation (DUF1610 family)
VIADPRLLDFRCPLCGSNNCAFVTFARKDGSSYVSELFQCGGCSVVFANREAFSKLIRDTYDSGRLWRERKPTRE